MSDFPPETLQLDPETMRRFGYAVVDLLVEQQAGLADARCVNRASRAEMERKFREPPPRQGSDPIDVLGRVRDEVYTNAMCLNHPRFFGWVPGPTNFISVMAESLAAGLNPFMGSWLVSAAPSTIELVTVDWLRSLAGMPESAGGLFLSGGSMANLTAMAAAREARSQQGDNQGIVYASSETHTSIPRALRVIGFPAEAYRTLPVDCAGTLPIETLTAAIDADIAAGRRPICVVGNAGTTNTGAVDPLRKLRAVCDRYKLWFHIDAAYGAPAAWTAAAAPLFDGLGDADSVTMDPHKWLFQPYEMGCLLVRDRSVLPRTFSIYRDYLRDAVAAEDEVNFRDYGVQLTRSFRALKLWMSLQVFGLDAFREAIGRGIALAEFAEEELTRREGWQVVTPARIGLITFRRRFSGGDAIEDRRNQRLSERMYEDGHAVLSTTEIDGRPVLRFCTVNPRTRREDLCSTLDRFETFAREVDEREIDGDH